MLGKLLLYAFVTVVVIREKDSVNINQIFKKNHEEKSKVL